MISIPGTCLRRPSMRMNCNKLDGKPGSQIESCPTSVKGAPGPGMGVAVQRVGRGVLVVTCMGTRGVCSKESVGKGAASSINWVVGVSVADNSSTVVTMFGVLKMFVFVKWVAVGETLAKP